MFRKDYIRDAKAKKGEEVEIAGWIHKMVDKGKIKFITLRDRTGMIQVIAKTGAIPDELMARISGNKEYVVRIKGKIVESKMAPDGVELVPTDYEILNKVDEKLPVDPTEEVPSDLETRLEYRYLDLRRKKINAIFELKSIIVNSYRQKLVEMGYVEIHPPAIIAAASEGGTDVFELKYFENKAYLAQSPQLYKQIAVIGGLDKVFSTMPVFRAEKHNTTTHLNEITMLDVEIGFADHHDAMDVLEEVFITMLKAAAARPDLLSACGAEINVPHKIRRISYAEVIELLKKAGENIEWGARFLEGPREEAFRTGRGGRVLHIRIPDRDTRVLFHAEREGPENLQFVRPHVQGPRAFIWRAAHTQCRRPRAGSQGPRAEPP